LQPAIPINIHLSLINEFFPDIEQAKEKLWDTWGASLQQPSKTWSSSVEDYPVNGELSESQLELQKNGVFQPHGYGSIPIHTIFRGMNIHLPVIWGSPGG
jgi:hypothetical protein